MRYSIKDYSRTAAGKGWGKGWPACAAKSQTVTITAPISGVRVTVHKRVARLAYLLIAETERRGYLLRAGQCWGGNCRAIAGSDEPSNHSWWLAIDLNSLANPYVIKIKGRAVTDMPAWLPLLWNAFGWAWGGDYSGSKADAMHLEFMGSPEDADDMTALAEQRLTTRGSGAIALPSTEETFMAGLSDVEQRDLYNRIMGRDVQRWMTQLPDGSPVIVGPTDPTGWPARSADVADILSLGKALGASQDQLRALVDAGNRADAERDAALAASVAALGTDPAQIAETLRVALGSSLAHEVVAELGRQLTA